MRLNIIYSSAYE